MLIFKFQVSLSLLDILINIFDLLIDGNFLLLLKTLFLDKEGSY